MAEIKKCSSSSILSPEIQLFQTLAGEIADDIYVVDKKTYRLLYANELKTSCWKEHNGTGETCYQILYGKSQPCEFCTLNSGNSSLTADDITFEDNGRFFTSRSREMDWNGTLAPSIRSRRDGRGHKPSGKRTAGAVFPNCCQISSRRNGCATPYSRRGTKTGIPVRRVCRKWSICLKKRYGLYIRIMPCPEFIRMIGTM